MQRLLDTSCLKSNIITAFDFRSWFKLFKFLYKFFFHKIANKKIFEILIIVKSSLISTLRNLTEKAHVLNSSLFNEQQYFKISFKILINELFRFLFLTRDFQKLVLHTFFRNRLVNLHE